MIRFRCYTEIIKKKVFRLKRISRFHIDFIIHNRLPSLNLTEGKKSFTPTNFFFPPTSFLEFKNKAPFLFLTRLGFFHLLVYFCDDNAVLKLARRSSSSRRTGERSQRAEGCEFIVKATTSVEENYAKRISQFEEALPSGFALEEYNTQTLRGERRRCS